MLATRKLKKNGTLHFTFITVFIFSQQGNNLKWFMLWQTVKLLRGEYTVHCTLAKIIVHATINSFIPINIIIISAKNSFKNIESTLGMQVCRCSRVPQQPNANRFTKTNNVAVARNMYSTEVFTCLSWVLVVSVTRKLAKF